MWKRLFVYQVSDFRCFEHAACGAEKCKDNCAQVISLISQFSIRIHLSIFFMLRIFSSTVSYMTIERAMLALKVFYAHTNNRKLAKIKASQPKVNFFSIIRVPIHLCFSACAVATISSRSLG